MYEEINNDRRRLLGNMAMTFAAVPLFLNGLKGDGTAAEPTAANQPSFGTLKQIDAGLLSIGYAEAGPADGPPVVLIHGWPYDIYTYVDVVPLLAAKGYRVIVPFLRGY